AVVVVRTVTEQQWRRPGLSGLMAARDEVGVRLRVADLDAHGFVPAIRERGKTRVQRSTKVRDNIGQRVAKVLVFAPAETVPRHDHLTAEPALVVIEPRNVSTLIGGQHLLEHGPTVAIEMLGDARPVDTSDTGVDAGVK